MCVSAPTLYVSVCCYTFYFNVILYHHSVIIDKALKSEHLLVHRRQTQSSLQRHSLGEKVAVETTSN